MKALSINKLDKLIKMHRIQNERTIPFDVGDETIEVMVKSYVSPADMSLCVKNIADGVFIEQEDGIVQYTPSLYESSLMLNYLAFFTNIKVESGLDRIFEMMYGCNGAFDVVLPLDYWPGAISQQWNDIVTAANAEIDLRKQMLVADGRDRMNQALDHLSRAAEGFQVLNDHFSGLDPSVMTKALENMSEMSTDEIVDVIMRSKDNEH